MHSTTTVHVSFFANETDTTPRSKTFTVEELFTLLTQHQERPHKRRGELWSPFVFDGARKGDNMRESTLLAFDIDDGTPPDQVIDWLQGLTYIVASTWSSTPEHWKLRVVIELTEPVPAADYSSVWHAAVEELLHGHVDPSTHDLARMFYLPACPPGSVPYADGDLEGLPLDWRKLPRWEPPERTPVLNLDDIDGLDASVERRRAQAMLQKWCLDIAYCEPGLRHEAILRLGRAAGGLVGSGALAYEEVYAELLDAADACGEVADHGRRDVDRAIRNALEYGQNEPWTPAQLGDSDDWLTAPKIRLKGKTSSAPTSSAPREFSGSTTGRLVVHTVAEERDLAPEEVEWLIEGWLGKGMMTELVGKVKSGKTTFVMRSLSALVNGDELYCGQKIARAARVMYVTEEGRQTFHEALKRYGAWDFNDEFCIVYEFEMADIKLAEAVDLMIAAAAEHQVDVVVIDTLTTIAGLDDEDNSSRVGMAMREFRRIANAGYAVWTLRHGRKIGGEVGDAGRGSSAISGAVDILLQLDPFKGDDDDSNLRIMRAKGRMMATPTEPRTLEFDKLVGTYSLVGQTVSREARLAALILNGLEELEAFDQDRGKTSNEITLKIGKRQQSVRDELKRMTEDGQVFSGTRATSQGGTPAKIFWLPPVIRLHPDEPAPVVETPAPVVPEAEPRTHTRADPEGVQPETNTSSDPILFLKGQLDGSTTGRKREKTPEAQAKAAAEKAARERARLEAADAAAPTLPYLVVPRDKTLRDALTLLDATQPIALDTETTGLNARSDRLRTIQLSDGTTNVVIDVWAQRDLSQLDAWLVGVEKVLMHTYLFDLAFLAQAGVGIDPSVIVDVRTAAMVLESKEDWTDYRLQGIAKRHLKEHVSKTEQKRGWDVEELRHAKLAYAAEDARVTHAVGGKLEILLAQDADVDALWSVLQLERDVQQATWWLASAGAPADAGVMREAVAQQEDDVAARLLALNQIAGANGVNWRSPKQVLPILIEHGLDVESTSEDALMESESDEAIVDALLRYRSAGACLGLLRKAQSSIAADGRIYASFSPIGAQTGRTSCSEPNLQNLPHETLARSAIRPPEGRVFVRADYSQLQLVIAAWIAQDTEMLRVLNEPFGDIHQRTADAVGCSRQQAKAVNFGFLFGAGAETFRREQRKNGIILTLPEAARYRQTFMRTYRGIRSWHHGLGQWGDEKVVFDPSGSGRRRSAIFSNNVKANTPVQMVEAHGFKLALQNLYNSRHEAPSARLVMMVHDELIAECDETQDAVTATQQWLLKGMLEPMQALLPGVTVRVDVKVTRSYADADKA